MNSANKPTAGKPAGNTASSIADSAANKKANHQKIGKPAAANPADKVVDKSTANIADKPADKSTANVTDKPADKSIDKSAPQKTAGNLTTAPATNFKTDSVTASASTKSATPVTASTSAKFTTAAKPPTKRKPLKWKLILFLIIIGGGGYYAWQQPILRPYMQHAADYTIAMISGQPSASTTDTAHQSAKQIPKTEKSETTAKTETTAKPKQVTQSQQIGDSAKWQAMQKQVAAIASTLAQLQNENRELRAQLTRFSATPATQDISTLWTMLDELRIEVIDLQLRQNGNTAAAAAALSSLAPTTRINRNWMNGEINRLQNAAAYDAVLIVMDRIVEILKRRRDNHRQNSANEALSALQKNPAAATKDSDTTENATATENAVTEYTAALPSILETAWLDTATAAVKWFNIRRASDGVESIDIGDDLSRLRRLRELFIAKKRKLYLQELSAFAARRPTSADKNMQIQIDLLQTFGAPLYELTPGAFP